MKERVVSGFNASRTDDFDVEDRHSGGREVFEDGELEALTSLSKTRVKIKKNWHDHWE